MNVMLVSQCSKQALPATRRILDQFAERKGNRTWLTPITEAGLSCLHQLLRQNARRNTAVACHLIRGNRIELIWIVGNRQKFSSNGTVPTDSTSKNIVGKFQEDGWRHTESIALMASIAGLFHDFGKANKLFQVKLQNSIKGKSGKRSEPLRHEWLSVRLFEAFVAERDDAVWLQCLGEMDESSGARLISRVIKDGETTERISLLHKLKDHHVAWTVAWLILSHHRLPVLSRGSAAGSNDWARYSRADSISKWEKRLSPSWNSPQFLPNPDAKIERQALTDLWEFPKGLPCDSMTWRKRAAEMSKRAAGHPGLLEENWRENTFAQHLARCALMLADHHYSGSDPTSRWQDPRYKVLANTHVEAAFPGTLDKKSGVEGRVAHQKLDEHCIGVAHNAYWIARSLPRIRDVLPALSDVRALKRSAKAPFQWQNKAYAMATQARQTSARQGGFYVNMASTGTGKTLANARIAYGLSHQQLGCRFSVLLGLRSLTLQTGDALRERTGVAPSELAVMVGSSAVKTLHDDHSSEMTENESGSESAESFFSEHEYILYDGAMDQSRVGKWLTGKSGKKGVNMLRTLLSAPILVSTIDRLMPATESARGGHQITPMLRLLTADTVFDEPDDFGLKDLPALCRLVNWAGLLGNRVVFSSATLSPALVEALFASYLSGRQEFNSATLGRCAPISCGWVDEYRCHHELIDEQSQFAEIHTVFVKRRLQDLAKNAVFRRWAEIVPVETAVQVLPLVTENVDPSSNPENSIERLASTIASQVETLHQRHAITAPEGKQQFSVGLVRIANIDPLVAVAQCLARHGPTNDSRWHFCVYHSRHPLMRRSKMEQVLDRLLARHNPDAFWGHPEIHTMCAFPEKNQIIVILATDVATTGRDHHYDWAIVEPSSMRSIVQIAGRVRRHFSEYPPKTPNMVLLQQNVRALKGRDRLVYVKPGFENAKFCLDSRLLDEITRPDEIKNPSAAPCIVEVENSEPSKFLADLEHAATRGVLFSQVSQRNLDAQSENSFCADNWWQQPVRWCYQLQANTRFRESQIEATFALIAEDGCDGILFYQQNMQRPNEWFPQERLFRRVSLHPHERITPWPMFSDVELVTELDEKYSELSLSCSRFLGLNLREKAEGDATQWNYHPWLGVFSPVR